MEDGFVAYLGLEGEDAASIRGRSKVQFMQTTIGGREHQVNIDGGGNHVDRIRKIASIQPSQANRLTHVARGTTAHARSNVAGMTEASKLQNDLTYRAYLRQARQTVKVGKQAVEETKDDLSVPVVEQQLSELMQVRIAEFGRVARVMRVAELHRKEAERLTQMFWNEAIKRARTLHEDHSVASDILAGRSTSNLHLRSGLCKETRSALMVANHGRPPPIRGRLMGWPPEHGNKSTVGM